jgi:hypothetical protein
LRGVAAFDWDGSAWQPAGQAGPDVPTPYGVLQGVARFGWTGSAWAATGAPSFQRDFMSGSLGAGAVFTRASTGTYTNASGVLASAANDAPRFDYDPATLQPKGVLLETASTNLMLQSGDFNNVAWSKAGAVVAAPTTTANQATAPDGTLTAARIVWPQVIGTNASSFLYQAFLATAAPYAQSIWLKGNAGGEQIYLYVTNNAIWYSAARITLTTQWQRFNLITPALTAASWFFVLGVDVGAGAGHATTPAQTIYAWGGQSEAIGYTTSYIPTTGATASRAADALSYPIASVTGFDATKGSLAHEYIIEGAVVSFNAPAQLLGANPANDVIDVDEYANSGTAIAPNLAACGLFVGGTILTYGAFAAVPVPANVVHRGASAWSSGLAMIGAHDGVGTTSSAGSATSVPVIANLSIGGIERGQPMVSQWARRIRYWPRALSQSELIMVTS